MLCTVRHAAECQTALSPPIIEAAIGNFTDSFSLARLEDACSGVSRDMIRRVLRNLQAGGNVECLGRGSGAAWRKRR